MIIVKIRTSDALLVTKETYSYVEFDELSEALFLGDKVEFILTDRKKDIYQGFFEKSSHDLTVHEDISMKITEMIESGQVKKKRAEAFLKKLNQSFITSEEYLMPPIGSSEPAKKIESKKFTFSWLSKVKKVFLVLLALFLLSAAVIGGKTYLGNKSSVSYEELIKKGEYVYALKKYPNKETNLVEKLYMQKKAATLLILADKGDSKLAAFYYDFLNENWKKVTSAKSIKQDATIQVMRGYAYLKQNELEEAELINKELKNQTLKEQIDLFQKKKAYEELRNQQIESAEGINNKLKDKQLTEDIRVAKSIINLLQKYQVDKDNPKLSEQERQKASSDYQTWKENLNKLEVQTNEK